MTVGPKRSQELLDAARGKRIAVVGDFMLDRHLVGSVRRISPEAPVPVVEIELERVALGGAGNVVQNLASLGAIPVAFGMSGDDQAGRDLCQLLDRVGCGLLGMLKSSARKTTEKVRIIAQDQHVVRADRETVEALGAQDEAALLAALKTAFDSFDAVICQDYNKGVLTTGLIRSIIELCSSKGIRVAVDPKFDHFYDYHGCALFKPNVRELEAALGRPVRTDEQLSSAAKEVFERVAPERLLVTRGEKGMELFARDGSREHIPTVAQKVHDVSGAGDTVIATYVVAEVGGATPREAAELANKAAGIVCGEVGVVPIMREQLLAD